MIDLNKVSKKSNNKIWQRTLLKKYNMKKLHFLSKIKVKLKIKILYTNNFNYKRNVAYPKYVLVKKDSDHLNLFHLTDHENNPNLNSKASAFSYIALQNIMEQNNFATVVSTF